MSYERYAEVGFESGIEGNLYGPGAGLHAYSDDDFLGHVLFRTGPENDETGLRGARS